MLWWQILLIVLGAVVYLGIGFKIVIRSDKVRSDKDRDDQSSSYNKYNPQAIIINTMVVLFWFIILALERVMRLIEKLNKKESKF